MLSKFWNWLLSLFSSNDHVEETVVDEIEADASVDTNVDGQLDVEEEIEDEPPTDIGGYVPEDRKPDKFALLIGINQYDPYLNADLNGCVNDVTNMYEILVDIYGFNPDNIRIITDYRATRDNIVSMLTWLCLDRVAGDELYLHYSGHGSQVRDDDGDELDDMLDEILCPHDLDWDDPLRDDDIHNLFSLVNPEAFLTFTSDSCHSGTIFRSVIDPNKEPPKKLFNSKFIQPPVDISYRFKDRELPLNKVGVDQLNTPIQKHVMLSGCRDDQTSADAYINGSWQGALTSSLVSAIKRNPIRSWQEIHADIIEILNKEEYTQRPQLTGATELTKNRNIFGS